MRRAAFERLIGGFILLGLLISTGCSISEATHESYVEPGFEPAAIQRVAVFPIKNTHLAPVASKGLNLRLGKAMRRANPHIQIVSAEEVQGIVDGAGLSGPFATFMVYFQANVRSQAMALREFGALLNVDAILQGEVVEVEKQDGVIGQTRGTTDVTIRYTMHRVDDGKLVWGSTSDGHRGTATTVEDAPPTSEAANLALDLIAEHLPFGPGAAQLARRPDEKDKPDEEDEPKEE